MINRTWLWVTSPMWISLDGCGSVPAAALSEWGKGEVTQMSAHPTLAVLGLQDCNHLGQNDNLMLPWRPCHGVPAFNQQVSLPQLLDNCSAIPSQQRRPKSLSFALWRERILPFNVHLALLTIPLKERNTPKQAIPLKQINNLHTRQGEGRGERDPALLD